MNDLITKIQAYEPDLTLKYMSHRSIWWAYVFIKRMREGHGKTPEEALERLSEALKEV